MLGLGVALPGRQASWVMQEVYILNTCGSCVHSGQAMNVLDLHACPQMVCKIAAACYTAKNSISYLKAHSFNT